MHSYIIKGKCEMRKILKYLLNIFIIIILFILILAINSANYLLNAWGEVKFATVLYQLLSPLKGTNQEIIDQYCREALYPAIAIIFVGLFLWYLWFYVFRTISFRITGTFLGHNFSLNINSKKIQKLKILKGILGTGIFMILCVGVVERAEEIGVFEYVNSIMRSSTIFEEEYVKPENSIIEFNSKQKNLIYIYLESMESTYMDKDSGGQKDINYIPNLTQLAEENISFSSGDKNEGLLTAINTEWTMAAILGSTTGVPYKLPIENNSAGNYEKFLPGIVSLGDVLKDFGYQNYFMCGSPIAFGGREDFLTQHGDYTIFDYDTGLKDGLIPEGYYEFWGFEDCKLYEYAKTKLKEVVNKGERFNFTLLTVDTHHSEGYICEKCMQEYDEQYANAISCADVQIKNFLDWIKRQEWYEDTVIVVTGDHISMNNTFFDDVEKRTIYNCIINSETELLGKTKNRQACILDMFPTTLAAMGATIEGERLGLGTNLFSGKETLLEKMGADEFNRQISRYSKYYDKAFIRGK